MDGLGGERAGAALGRDGGGVVLDGDPAPPIVAGLPAAAEEGGVAKGVGDKMSVDKVGAGMYFPMVGKEGVPRRLLHNQQLRRYDMPPLKTYRIFISHAWTYDDDYYRLVNLLNEAPLFKWWNYSAPKHDGLRARTNKELKKEIDEQVRPVNAVLIISGMYVNHSEWIQYEIEVAQSYKKPIIGIKPRGAQVTPVVVREAAIKMVGWNTTSIVDAIRKYAI